MVARSSAEAECWIMAMTTYEFIWIKQLLKGLKCGENKETELLRDNEAAFYIASSLVFHRGPYCDFVK